MKKHFSISIALILSLLISTQARQQKQTASQEPAAKQETDKKNDVVKISVTLVQVDVTVTDKKGKPVTDLKAEDFDVSQDNRPQRITNFSYVTAQPVAAAAATVVAAKPAESNIVANAPAPPVQLKPEQVRRTIALVVDDLTLSFGSTASVRQALRKFVDQQMQPGDLAAIIRTGAGMGALQQFTNDKRQLYSAIERVTWKPGYAGINTFSPITTDPAPGLNNPKSTRIASDSTRDLTGTFGVGGEVLDTDTSFRQEVFAIGTLGALNFIIGGLKELPGRKSVVLFSDALRIYNREQNIYRVQQALDNLTDLANRASVSIYTIDARGLEVLGMTAADDLAGDLETPDPRDAAPGAVNNTDYSKFIAKTETGLADRSRDFFESQEGLRYLADKTGGIFSRNNNDLSRGVDRALRDQEGYYLIGFVPEASTFKSKNGSREFHNIKVTVKRPDLRVRTRTGFYGLADEESRPLSGTAGQQLLRALASPFATNGIKVRMTSQFGYDAKQGHFMNALLHIDARDLTFEETVNGWRRVMFEIAAFTFGDNGRVIDHSDRAYTVSMSDKDYQRTLESGIFYRVNLPIKKPGAYQLRTAVRDSTSKRIGSANQFIEVPDVKKGRLALSGLIVRGANEPTANTPEPVSAGEQAASTKEGRVVEVDPQAGPAVRKFQRGRVIEYGYMIYNARADKAVSQPQLETQLRLYRDGKQIYASPVKELKTVSEAETKRLIAGGSLRLGGELTAGDYILQVVVTDKLAKDKKYVTSQWIDFEIVK